MKQHKHTMHVITHVHNYPSLSNEDKHTSVHVDSVLVYNTLCKTCASLVHAHACSKDYSLHLHYAPWRIKTCMFLVHTHVHLQTMYFKGGEQISPGDSTHSSPPTS